MKKKKTSKIVLFSFVSFVALYSILTIASPSTYLWSLSVSKHSKILESILLDIGAIRFPDNYYVTKAIGLIRFERGMNEFEESGNALDVAIGKLPDSEVGVRLLLTRHKFRKMIGKDAQALEDLYTAKQLLAERSKNQTIFGISLQSIELMIQELQNGNTK